MRQFFWAPKTYAKIYGLESIYNFTLKFVVYLNLCYRFHIWLCQRMLLIKRNNNFYVLAHEILVHAMYVQKPP